jgi:putative chitinase
MSLKKFQEKIGATPDGVFGKQTLTKGMEYLKLTKEQTAHFFAQTSHETGEFKLFSENLNYSADGLMKTFGKYFPTKVLAMSYARQPEKIANRVYGNRMGNGPESSGDGWKFRGQGALQLTGKDNYTAFVKYLGKPEILTNPNLVATDFAFESALFFFERNKLWNLCTKVDDASILTVRKRVNGGTNGLADCVAKTKKYYALLS